MSIAYQGEPGAYSEAAALKFSPHADVLPCDRFEAVFDAVERRRATHGILPVENSVGGSIHRNFDLLAEYDLPIVGEVELLVDHCLIVPTTSIRPHAKEGWPGPSRAALSMLLRITSSFTSTPKILAGRPSMSFK